MSVWPVFIDSWQQQSGGQPFAMGDEVEWKVELIDGREHGWPDELLVDARVQLRPCPELLSMAGSVAVSGGVVAWWPGSDPSGSVLELRGALLEDHHGRGFVYTRGLVRRIQVITQRYEPRADGVLLATWEGWQAHDVSFSSAGFRRDVQLAPESFGNGWHSGRVKSAETGLLVALEPDLPTSPSVLQVRSLERPSSQDPRCVRKDQAPLRSRS